MAFSLIAHATNGSVGGVSNTINTTGANLIVINQVNFAGGTGGSGILPPTDNKGNTWTLVASYNDGLDVVSGLYYCSAPSVGSGHTFTPGSTVGPGVDGDCYVLAFSGAATSSPLDGSNFNGVATSSNVLSLQPGSITPSTSGCLVITGFANVGTGNTAPSGYTGQDVRDNAASGGWIGGGIAWVAQGSATATNPTWTWSANVLNEANAAIASFLPPAGSGNVVSGGATEGADATSGSIKVAIKASGGPTEGKDATSGTIKLASKVSGGATEGPDATAGAVKVALKVSGGVTEGADFTTGAISVGSTHVSGSLTEGADATGGGSIKVALHVSGGLTEGKDATAGNLLVAVKVSGGITEGADFTTGSITATSRTISGGFTEGADRTTGIIISGTVSQGGHFLPLTKKEIAEARKRAKAARDKEEAGWDQAAKDKADLHQQIMKTLHPEKILGTGKIQTPEDDDDEADIEMLLLYG